MNIKYGKITKKGNDNVILSYKCLNGFLIKKKL